MEKVFSLGFLCLMLIVLSACGTSNSESLATSTPEPAISETELASSAEQSEPTESSAPSSAVEVLDEEESTYRTISVQFGESFEIIYGLNDGTAADSFYEQLPPYHRSGGLQHQRKNLLSAPDTGYQQFSAGTGRHRNIGLL